MNYLIPNNDLEVKIIIDVEDFDQLSKHIWNCTKVSRGGNTHYQIVTHVKGTKSTTISLPNLLMSKPPIGFTWDHKNRDSLDNRKDNFRLANGTQQSINRDKTIYAGQECSSKYKGVSFRAKANKYEACIQINKKYHYIGQFINEEDAARAYNEKALEHYGEFACLNELG